MATNAESDRLDRQTVEELTALMRYEWDDLRAVLRRRGLDPGQALLAAFCEDEYGREYGVVVTPEARVYEYVRKTSAGRARGRVLQWDDRTGDKETARKWGSQVRAALTMAKAGLSDADLTSALRQYRASQR